MSCVLTQSQNRACNDSKGGSNEIYLATSDMITGKPTVVDGEVTAITMASTYKFKKYECAQGVINAAEKSTTDPKNGTSQVEQTVMFQIVKNNLAKRNEAEVIKQANLVAIVKDNNDNYWMYGYHNYLNSEFDGGTGTAYTDLNGAKVTLKGVEPSFAYSVDPDIIAGIL